MDKEHPHSEQPLNESDHDAAKALPPSEIIETTSKRVWCDNGGGPLGHPRVYYDMGENDFVDCNYCDRRFVYVGAGAGEGH